MVKVKKVAHVVLGVRDAKKSMDWYKDALGMEPMTFIPGINMGFLSFGTQHHDLALVDVKGDQPVGSPGASHVALEIEGGLDELKEIYNRLKSKGVKVEEGHDFGFLNGFYFYDPDGNRLELFYDYLSQEDGAQTLKTRGGASFRKVDLEAAAAK